MLTFRLTRKHYTWITQLFGRALDNQLTVPADLNETNAVERVDSTLRCSSAS